MDIQEKIGILAGILDREESTIRPEMALDEIGWDSMAMLSVIAMVKTRFGKKITGAQIRGFKTIQDVLNEME